jgi:hypothetical protein
MIEFNIVLTYIDSVCSILALVVSIYIFLMLSGVTKYIKNKDRVCKSINDDSNNDTQEDMDRNESIRKFKMNNTNEDTLTLRSYETKIYTDKELQEICFKINNNIPFFSHDDHLFSSNLNDIQKCDSNLYTQLMEYNKRKCAEFEKTILAFRERMEDKALGHIKHKELDWLSYLNYYRVNFTEKYKKDSELAIRKAEILNEISKKYNLEPFGDYMFYINI